MRNNRVKEFRENKGMTQDELAELVGVERSQISKIETGISNGSMDTMLKLSKALSCTLDELVEKKC